MKFYNLGHDTFETDFSSLLVINYIVLCVLVLRCKCKSVDL